MGDTLLELLERPKFRARLDVAKRQRTGAEDDHRSERSWTKRHQRRKVFKGGKITFNNGSSVLDCTVRDLSESGAKIEIKDKFAFPRLVTLLISDGAEYQCAVARVINNSIGLRILKVLQKGDNSLSKNLTLVN